MADNTRQPGFEFTTSNLQFYQSHFSYLTVHLNSTHAVYTENMCTPPNYPGVINFNRFSYIFILFNFPSSSSTVYSSCTFMWLFKKFRYLLEHAIPFCQTDSLLLTEIIFIKYTQPSKRIEKEVETQKNVFNEFLLRYYPEKHCTALHDYVAKLGKI